MAGISEFVLNYVVNATWQIAVIAFVAVLGSLLLRSAPARYRHLLWLVALASCVVVPLLTATASFLPATHAVPVPADRSAFITAAPTSDAQAVARPLSPESDLSPFLTQRRTRVVTSATLPTLWLVLAYAIFVAWRVIRLVRFWQRKARLAISPELAAYLAEVEKKA